jgi:hypothetical protein
MEIDQLYALEIRDQTGRFANWFPNSPVDIGHYGSMQGALFQPLNQMKGLKTTIGSAVASLDFTINATRTINTNAQAVADAGLTKGKALLEVGFQKEAGVTFSAPETRIERVDDIEALGKQLMAMAKSGTWGKDNGIIVEVVRANRATIITSVKSGAEIKFGVEADTPINPAVMANLNANTSVVVEKGVGAKVIGEGPIVPLFRLAFLKWKLGKGTVLTFRGPGGEPAATEKVDLPDEHYLEIV